jgi:hypothetical protein
MYKIKNLKRIFGSNQKSQEIIFLLDDLKPVVRQGFYESEKKRVEDFCIKNQLFFAYSKFKIKLMENGFTNKAVRVKKNETEKGMEIICISKNEEYAQRGAFYEDIQEHERLGILLGYPKCCVDYFVKNFNENNTNPEIKSDNIYTNLSKRKQDYCILSHFPCSRNCLESVRLAKAKLLILERYDLDYVKELKVNLKNAQI